MNEEELQIWQKVQVMRRAKQSNITMVDPEKLHNEIMEAEKQMVNVEMKRMDLFKIIQQIQVTVSHPMLETKFQQATIEIGKKLQNQFFEPNSEMWKTIEIGWPPD